MSALSKSLCNKLSVFHQNAKKIVFLQANSINTITSCINRKYIDFKEVTQLQCNSKASNSFMWGKLMYSVLSLTAQFILWHMDINCTVAVLFAS